MKTTDYIESIKEKFSLSSDYKVCKLLGISTARLANYRSGRSAFGDEIAIKVAELLEIPVGQVLIDMHAERAKDKDVKKAWTELSKKVGGMAAGVLLASGVHFAPYNSDSAMESGNYTGDITEAVYYVKFMILLFLLATAAKYRH